MFNLAQLVTKEVLAYKRCLKGLRAKPINIYYLDIKCSESETLRKTSSICHREKDLNTASQTPATDSVKSQRDKTSKLLMKSGN